MAQIRRVSQWESAGLIGPVGAQGDMTMPPRRPPAADAQRVPRFDSWPCNFETTGEPMPPTSPTPKRQMRNASATQISTFELCARKWFWQWPLGQRPEPSRGMLLGRELHGQAERYLRDGIEPEHALVQLGRPHLPLPKTPDVLIEQRISIDDGPVPTIGYIDVLDLSGSVARVIDHKFISSLRWAKSSAELRANTQMNIYGLWAAREYGLAELELWHLSYQTRGAPRCQPSHTRMSRERLEANWEGALTSIKEMHALSLSANAPEDAPGKASAPNHAACMAYGGCPFLSQCAAIEGGRLRLFDGIESIPMQRNEELAAAFEALPACDQMRALKGFTVTSIDELATSKRAEEALASFQRWSSCPTPTELQSWVDLLPEQHRAKWMRLRAYMLSAHPITREQEVAKIRGFLQHNFEPYFETLAKWRGYFAKHALEDENRPPTPEELATHSGVINPPDAAPNAVPQPPDPREAPVTTLAGIGKTLSRRIGEALGLDPEETPTIAQTAAALSRELVKSVKGLSARKAQQIREAAKDGDETEAREEEAQQAAPQTAGETQSGPEQTGVVESPADDGPAAEEEGVAVAEERPDVLRDAITQVEAASYVPDTVRMHPGDAVAAGLITQEEVDGTIELYVDCVVSRSRSDSTLAYQLEDLLDSYQRDVEKEHGVAHYAMLDFGKGPIEVAAKLAAALDAAPHHLVVFASSHNPHHAPALEVLMQRATMIVKGIGR